MFLDYLSLVILILALMAGFYGVVWLTVLPYRIARLRDHPHAEAIHVACWLSLLTLQLMWPILFIWAVMRAKSAEEAARGKLTPFVVGDDGVDVDLAIRIGRIEERLHMAGVLDANEQGGG